MSAWDIVGAAIWSPLAFGFWCWCWTIGGKEETPPGHTVTGVLFAIATTAAAVFSIARLCGAHA